MYISGEIAALLAALCWSGSSLTFTAAIKRVGSVNVNVSRMFIAAIYLFFTIWIFNISHNLSNNQYFLLIISGWAGLVFGDTYLFKAFDLIGARFTMLITCTVPAINTFLGYIILNETLSLINILGIAVTIFGIIIVVFAERNENENPHHHIKKGIFYALLASVGQAIGLLLAKIALDEGSINSFVATEVRIVSSTLLLLPIMLALRKLDNPIKVFSKNRSALLFTLFASFIGPFLGITLSMIAISNAKLGIASTLMATSPIILLPLSHIIHREILSAKSIVGTIVAVSGIAILFLL